MYKFKPLQFYVTAFVLLLCVKSNAQSTQSVTKNFSDFQDSWNPVNVSVPSFNSALGTLTGVLVKFKTTNSNHTNIFQVENQSVSSSTMQAYNNHKFLDIDLNVDGSASSVSIEVLKRSNFPFTMSAYDGIVDFSGTSGITFYDSVFQYMYQNNVSNLNNFIGDGTTEVQALTIVSFLSSFSYSISGGAASVNLQTAYDVSVEVIYTYTPSTPLPIRIMDFKGTATAKGNLLTWKMADTKEAKSIVIERNVEGENFETIATLNLQDAGQFLDKDFKTATNLYRLKVIEKNDEIIYSRIASIRNSSYRANSVVLYPNPVINGKLYIAGETNYQDILLTGMNGATHKLKAVTTSDNLTCISLPETLSPGIYNITLINETGSITQQILIR